ncbi:bifunctional [glutamine synthetase] adenylyltransferase/[glutamine synthetase]-adenylyl-L-tyrosine phosphorylase [Acuticoccus sp. MNP-M23]|uniref:bifunctional [glutamine synthetase] adenylyltransferase/[glutamine synthetase]-adenylyl-L-tyrosine phosphorylase n=1 Tax=Acuticoccus sp. MNP-M23 TaxID=3072793 RepID=UPI0028162CFE|nr:bifunctional [glutamine synthetase] adenylyltransferase/[glutamine synthetase]-adenylyl-L-tyrosine phosphorylase [Acuticoccus sp. MNP-M23]WMS41652.1 bifunctional [glutamine synthetase] adenylyltransferase/[glutamine synthetase]-adenylyl-L-tyrosine phosphorylase [Acuticoccus sp. MNP-M23]
MSALAENFTPLPIAPDTAFAEKMADARAEAGVAPLPEPVAEALGTVAAVSPFLADLMLGDPAMLDAVLAASLNDSVAAAAVTGDDVAASLRRGKQRVALAVGLADLLGNATVKAVTNALSDFADAAIAASLNAAFAELCEKGQVSTDDPSQAGLFVLAMGKLGGRELNYSSDVDLVILFDPVRAQNVGLARDTAVRLVRRFVQLMQDRTADGYVFRVDLRLRPDPGATALAVSTPAAIKYYQSRARPWERQAMIKARAVAGDETAAAAYMDAVEPSIWRVGYDFAAIDETVALREQIAAVKGAGAITVPGHNVKVGRGGIREIEFFAQSLQRVAGGRDLALRGHATVPMLAALCERGWVSETDCAVLTDAYETLRKVEHRLQMVRDDHVHTMPDAAGVQRIAVMMRDEALTQTLEATLRAVHARFMALADGPMPENPMLRALQADRPELSTVLAEAFDERRDAWQAGCYSCLRTEQARTLLARLEPAIRTAIASSPDSAVALERFDAFLATVTRGVDFLARLDRHPDLVGVIVLIAASSPRLAEQLARRGRLLDVLIDPTFYGRAHDDAALEASLGAALEAAQDYEERLDALRVVGQEQMLLIEVRILTGSLLSAEAGVEITTLAERLAGCALSIARDAFAERHGHVEGGGVALLALGSFGSREMTPSSDLDIVFIYDAADESNGSDGAKSLTPGHYFARLAQRFIAALSAPTARGRLFEVDLRLRPTGRAGPLATHIRSFERYQAESAWVWEQMALTRARVVAGDEAVGARAMAAIDRSLAACQGSDALAGEVLAMRRKLDGLSRQDAKHAPGGLVDIEFIVQFLRLKSGLETRTTMTRKLLNELAAAGMLDDAARELLVDSHRLLRKLMLLFSAAGVPARPAEAPAALKPLLLRAADAPDMDFLEADLAERRTAVRALFEKIVGPLNPPDDGNPQG